MLAVALVAMVSIAACSGSEPTPRRTDLSESEFIPTTPTASFRAAPSPTIAVTPTSESPTVTPRPTESKSRIYPNEIELKQQQVGEGFFQIDESASISNRDAARNQATDVDFWLEQYEKAGRITGAERRFTADGQASDEVTLRVTQYESLEGARTIFEIASERLANSPAPLESSTGGTVNVIEAGLMEGPVIGDASVAYRVRLSTAPFGILQTQDIVLVGIVDGNMSFTVEWESMQLGVLRADVDDLAERFIEHGRRAATLN